MEVFCCCCFVRSVRKVEKVLPRAATTTTGTMAAGEGWGAGGSCAPTQTTDAPHSPTLNFHRPQGGEGGRREREGRCPLPGVSIFLVLNSLFFLKRNKILAFEKNVSLSGKRERGSRGGWGVGDKGEGEGESGTPARDDKTFFLSVRFVFHLSLSLFLSLSPTHTHTHTHTHALWHTISLSDSLCKE